MLLKSKYNTFKAATPSGEKIQIVYREELLPDGTYGLVKDSEIDLEELIDSQREDCMLENIMARFAPGEPLVVKSGSDLDISQIPDNAIDFYNSFSRVKNAFQCLSPDQRANYVDFRDFLEQTFYPVAAPTVAEVSPDQTTLEEVPQDV